MAPSRNVLAVTGLALEARIIRGPGVATVCSGGNAGRLRELLGKTDPRTLSAVLSFGLAGGLDPSLRTGDVVIAQDVRGASTAFPTHDAMSRALHHRLSGGNAAPFWVRVLGSDVVVGEAAEKAALHRTGVDAVDTESHVAADFAATHRLPFSVLRVICDPAERSLPPLAERALQTTGRIDVAAVAASLARHPSQIGTLTRAGVDFAVAAAALRLCRRRLGVRFFADIGEFLLDVP